MISMDHLIQPHPGAHAKKLWKRPIDDVDPEPVFIPKSAPLCIAPVKVLKRCSAPRPTQPVKYNLSLTGFNTSFYTFLY